MPLDGHSYLVSQGWSGKGTGLRQGAITRPIVVTQKKTLAGLGKDRDEAFPFWDHLFSAASKAIKVKIDNSDDSDSDDNNSNPAPALKRTTTGILSNRRPVDVTPASTSGSATPDPSASSAPRLSLIALAKREAAKRHLYSKFYRGLVIVSDAESPNKPSISSIGAPELIQTMNVAPVKSSKVEHQGDADAEKMGEGKGKDTRKRKLEQGETDAERRERKRRKKELKAKEALDKEMDVDERREKKRRKKELKAKEDLDKKVEKKTKDATKIFTPSTDEMEKEERRRRRREKREKEKEKAEEEGEKEEKEEKEKKEKKEKKVKAKEESPAEVAHMDRRRQKSVRSKAKIEEHIDLPKVKKKPKAEAIS